MNPWWRGPTAIADDVHLRQRAEARFTWIPPALEAIPLVPGSTHTLRGPRQVGKTTTLKTLLARVLERGERRVLYYSFDLQRESRSIVEVVQRAKELHPDPMGPWYREQTVRMLWDIIAGDIQQAGRNKHSALKLLERVGVSLGAGVAWASLRENMDVGSHNTAKEYTHLLSEAFMLLTVFYRDAHGSFAPHRQRKLYYIDPLLARIAPTLVPGARRHNADGLIENLVAVALYRSAAETITLADPLPGAIGYWKSADNREIDFLVSPPTGGRGTHFPVEVKGDSLKTISGA